MSIDAKSIIESVDARYPKVTGTSDGRIVLDSVPNLSSISASLSEYEELPGIREVPLSDFHLTGRSYSVSETNRITDLAEQIRHSGKIAPLIVVVDSDPEGPYILEGGHRAEALFLLGAKSLPAVVVVDLDGSQSHEATSDFPIKVAGSASSSEEAIAAGFTIGPVWHGTEAGPFSEYRVPAFFTSDRGYAEKYGNPRMAYLRIANPVRMDQLVDGADAEELAYDPEWLAASKADGHDGIVMVDGDITDYVVFDPGQVMSVAESVSKASLAGRLLVVFAQADSSSLPERVQFLTVVVDGRPIGRVRTLQEASQKAEEARELGDATMDDWPTMELVDESGKVIGNVSYNGVVWPGREKDWTPGAVPLYDTKGMAIKTAGVVDNPSFKAWFGNSKVVDSEGKPLMMFHGTSEDFGTFDLDKGGGVGLYFTSDPEAASDYANITGRWKGGGDSVMPVYVSIRNPVSVKEWNAMTDRMSGGNPRKLALEAMSKKGYDGIIFPEDKNPGKISMAVAFRPDQVKSATGNIGTFDPENPDVTASMDFNLVVKTASSDDEYMKAVEAGDMTAAQKMVNEAAERAGFDVVSFHGSDENDFNQFSVQRTADGYFFSPDEATAGYYGPVRKFRLFGKNWADLDDEATFDKIAKEAIFNLNEERDADAVKEWAKKLVEYHGHPDVRAFVAELNNRTVEETEKDFDGDWESAVREIDYKDISEDLLDRHPVVKRSIDRHAPLRSPDLEFAREAYGSQEFYMNYQDDFMGAAQDLGYDGVILTDPAGSTGGASVSHVVFRPNAIKLFDAVTKDDEGKIIPLSQRFDAGSDDIRFDETVPVIRTAKTDKQMKDFDLNVIPTGPDAEYFKAVEAGDMASVQRIVDEAARAAGYATRAAHSTNASVFNEFRTGGLGAHFGTPQAAADRAKSLMDFSIGIGRNPGDFQTMDVYLSVSNPLRLPDMASLSDDGSPMPNRSDDDLQNLEDLGKEIPHPRGWENDEDVQLTLLENRIIDIDQFEECRGRDKTELVALLKEMGYDGIIYENSVESPGEDSYIIFDPNQVKLADPVVKDDSGNVIPPSKRFNTGSNDMRFDKTAPVVRTASRLGASLEMRARKAYPQTDSVDSSEYLFTDGTGISIGDDHRIINEMFRGKVPRGYYDKPGSGSGFMLAFMGETGAMRVRMSSDRTLNVSFIVPPSGMQVRAVAKTSAREVYVDRYGKHYENLATGKFVMPDEVEELKEFLSSGGSHGNMRTASSGKIRAFHGSGTSIEKFSDEFMGIGDDQFGSGLYFTTSPADAEGYAVLRSHADVPKPGGEETPTVHEVLLDIRRPLDADFVGTVPRSKIKRIMLASPTLEDSLSNWGDVEFEGRGKVIETAVDAYSQQTTETPIVSALFGIANDFYRGHEREFNDVVTKVLGYDGVVKHSADHDLYVAFRADQVEIVGRKPVGGSVEKKASTNDPEFKQWFGDKVKRAFRSNAIASITIDAPEVGAGWLDGGCRILARALKMLEPDGRIVTILFKFDGKLQGDHYGYEFADGGVVDGNGYFPDRNSWMEEFVSSEAPERRGKVKVVDGEYPSELVPTIPSVEKALADSIARVLSGKRVRKTKLAAKMSGPPQPSFLPTIRFIHMSADAESLLKNGWDSSKEGSVGGSLYKGISVTLPRYVDSWRHIAKLGGTTPVWVTLPAGKRLLDFYKTFGSMDAADVPYVRDWAVKNGLGKITTRMQVAGYDEDGNVDRWMEVEPGEEFEASVDGEPHDDDDPETREYTGFAGDDQTIFDAYVAEMIPEACGAWYADADDMWNYSAPQGIINVRFAGELKFSPVISRKASASEKPSWVPDEKHRRAIEGTPGARLTDEGDFEVEVERSQHPDQAGRTSVRSGVFWQPTGSHNKYPYSGKNGYGGLEKIKGKLKFKNPLFVKGSTGGRAPELAYDAVVGKGAYEKMRRNVLDVTMGAIFERMRGRRMDEEAVYGLLEKYGGDTDAAYPIVQFFSDAKGNGLAYAIQENIVANVVRNAGYDAIVGYGQKRDGTPFLSEVFDLTMREYPSKWSMGQVASCSGMVRLAVSEDGESVEDAGDFPVEVKEDGPAEVHAEPTQPVHEYRIDHQAPMHGDGAPLHDLTTDGIYPADFYEHPDWYGSSDPMEMSAAWLAVAYKGRPNAMVTIYRSVPKEVPARSFNVGDWVSTSRKYVVDHGKSELPPGFRVIQKTVHARDIFTAGDSLLEWGYDPQPRDAKADEARRERRKELQKERRLLYDMEMDPVTLKTTWTEKATGKKFDHKNLPPLPSQIKASAGGVVKMAHEVRGEYWIVDGDVSFADGEYGEIDHTGLAIQHATNSVLDAMGIDSNGESILISDYADDISDKFQEEGLPEERDVGQFVLRILNEQGIDDAYGLYEAAKGNGDPREYALMHWGWKRFADGTVQTQTLTEGDLSEITDGLSSIMEESGIDCESMGDVEFGIDVSSAGTYYSGVPYSVISSGRMSDMMQYRQKYASVEDFGITVTSAEYQRMRKDEINRVWGGFSDEAVEEVTSKQYEVEYQVLKEFFDNPNGTQPWRLIPAARLKKIWTDYSNTGVVRDEKGVDQIADVMIENALKLKTNTELCGHSPFSPEEIASRWDFDWDEKIAERFYDYCPSNRISDYATEPLVTLAAQLQHASSAEQKVRLIDRMLNVVHMRGDIAALFVEGGSMSLTELFVAGTDEEKPAEAAPVPKKEDPRQMKLNLKPKTKAAATVPATPEELRNLEFDVPNGGHSITPKKSFDWRDEMDEEKGSGESGHETLADLASYPDKWRLENVLGKGWEKSFEGTVPASLGLIPEIKAGRKIRIFRATDVGGIFPGAYVTESLPYAKMHGRTQFEGRKWSVYTIEARADELVSWGDPHEFIYVPKDPSSAHERMKKGTTPMRTASADEMKDEEESILKTVSKFWNSPELENWADEARKQTDQSGVKIGMHGDVGIYLVNGDVVKKESFPDFVEGGNDGVYGKGQTNDFIPPKRVWMDADLNVRDIPYIACHELLERKWMVDRGYTYDPAHEKANAFEMRLRKECHFESQRKTIEFPRVRQPGPGTCGHACLCMVLQYYGIETAISSIQDEATEKENKDGLAPEVIARIAKEYGTKAEVRKEVSIEDVMDLIDDDVPVIVELQAWPRDDKENFKNDTEDGHYVVAIGYTETHMLFADPSDYFRTFIPLDEIDDRWHDVDEGNVNDHTIIVVTKDEVDPFNGEKTVRMGGGFDIIVTGKLNLETGVDDAPASGHLDTQLFEACKGTKFDRDVVGKNRRRQKRCTKKAERDLNGEMIAELNAEYWKKWTPVDSSVVMEVAYFEPTGRLEVKTKNHKVYTFRGVPKHEYDSLMEAKSKGKWFADFCRRYRETLGKLAAFEGKIEAFAGLSLPSGMMAGDVADFLVTFLGYRRDRSSGTHVTFVKPGNHPVTVTVSLEGDRKLNPLRSGFSRALETQLNDWSAPKFRAYWADRKAWLRRAKQIGPDKAEKEFHEAYDYAKTGGVSTEQEPEEDNVVPFDVNVMDRDRINVVLSKVPYLKREFDVMKGHFEGDEVYQMIHDTIKASPQLLSLYESVDVGTPAEKTAMVRTASKWGKAGSGVMYFCPEDMSVLLLKRSPEVMDGNVWGIPGGAIKGTEGVYEDSELGKDEFDEDMLRDSAHKEVEEEMGHLPESEETGSVTIPFGNFKYTTFFRSVRPEQKDAILKANRLNWESTDAKWFHLNGLPKDIHPGVSAAIKRHFGGVS